MKLKPTYNKFFLYSLIATFVCGIVLWIIQPEDQKHMFFNCFGDFGADYFNVCRYVADLDPYGNTINGESEHAGFPLGYLFSYIQSLSADYSRMSLQECWTNISGCIFPFLLNSLFNLSVFLYGLLKLAGVYKVDRRWILLICLSSVVLFTLERGNSILLVAGLVNLFLYYYNSSLKSRRVLAIFLLSISGIFKMVPGLLCLMYVKDKRYKELVILILVTLLLIFIPFYFFRGGFENVMLIPRRIALQINTHEQFDVLYGFGFMRPAFLLYKHTDMEVCMSFGKFLSYVSLIASVILFFLSEESNKAVLYLMFVLALFAGSANVYNALYLFPLLLYTIATTDSRDKAVILFLFFFIIQPVQIVYHNQTLTYLFANLCALILWCYVLIFDGIKLSRAHGFSSMCGSHNKKRLES